MGKTENLPVFNPYKVFRGIFIPEALLALPPKQLSASAKLTWGALARHSGPNGRCFPSVETLGKELGLQERQVRQCLTELRRFPLIQVRRRGRGKSNEYHFVRHPVFGLDDRQDSAGQKPDDRQDSAALDRQDSAALIVKEKVKRESRGGHQPKPRSPSPVQPAFENPEVRNRAELIARLQSRKLPLHSPKWAAGAEGLRRFSPAHIEAHVKEKLAEGRLQIILPNVVVEDLGRQERKTESQPAYLREFQGDKRTEAAA